MAELIVQYKNKKGEKLYPVTLATAVVDSEGENVDVKLKKVNDQLIQLSKAYEDSSSSLLSIAQKLQLIDLSIQELDTKVEDFNLRLVQVDESVSHALEVVTQLNERVSNLETEIEILNADANTEGSVDNKINSALNWSTL